MKNPGDYSEFFQDVSGNLKMGVKKMGDRKKFRGGFKMRILGAMSARMATPLGRDFNKIIFFIAQF